MKSDPAFSLLLALWLCCCLFCVLPLIELFGQEVLYIFSLHSKVSSLLLWKVFSPEITRKNKSEASTFF